MLSVSTCLLKKLDDDDDDDDDDDVPRQMKIGSCGLHCEVAQTL